MFIRLILGVIFIATISGCATTQQKGANDQLQGRVVDLEKKLEEKDSEIVDLQYEVKDLHSKVANNRSAMMMTEETTTSRSTVDIGTDDKVIKVDASVSRVQTALKNAGHYNGKIDGKAGSGTKAAISAFQKSQGLTADGVVGRKTWESLKQYLK